MYGVLPRIMSAARRLNDGMGDYVANQVIKLMNKKGVLVKNSKILVLGFTFKENCPDIRNTKVIDIISTLREYTGNITIFDPWADSSKTAKEYSVNLTNQTLQDFDHQFDAVILAVSHAQFANIDPRQFLRTDNGVVYDVKGFFNRELIDGRL